MKTRLQHRYIVVGIVLSFVVALAGQQIRNANAATEKQSPRVVASIAPIHSLVSTVMVGVGKPTLLLPGTVSPHAYHLKPSDAALLEDAQVVFWVGPALETVLSKPMETIATRSVSVQLMDARALKILPRRKGGVLGHSGGDDQDQDHEVGDADPHVRLDPVNAIVMLFVISETMGELDPDNAAFYRGNAISGIERIKKLDIEIEQALTDVREMPYVAFHDAYQYFEDRYGLVPLATIAVDPDHAPGARRVNEVKTAIAQSGARCVFTEPQFDPGLVSTLIEGTEVRTGKLDPLGADIAPGPFFYDEMMHAMTMDLIACLAEN